MHPPPLPLPTSQALSDQAAPSAPRSSPASRISTGAAAAAEGGGGRAGRASRAEYDDTFGETSSIRQRHFASRSSDPSNPSPLAASSSARGGAAAAVPVSTRTSRDFTTHTTTSNPSSASGVRTAPTSQARGAAAWTEPILFERGMFVGRWISFLLEVAQEPINGRRKTDKDRRPLAHCPIVRLRMRESVDSESAGVGSDNVESASRSMGDTSILGGMSGTRRTEPYRSEDDLDLQTIEPGHFVCSADLNPSASDLAAQQSRSAGNISSSSNTDGTASYTTSSGGGTLPQRQFPTLSVLNEIRRDADSPLGYGLPVQTAIKDPPYYSDSRSYPDRIAGPGPSSLRYLLQASSTRRTGPHMDLANTSVSIPGEHVPHTTERARSSTSTSRRRGGTPDRRGASDGEARSGRESKKQKGLSGRNLHGNAHVSGIKVPAPEGGLGLWFLFNDLSIRQEGSYTLRFRCFDITAVDPGGSWPAPPLAQTQSQTFRVYSPRTFPGLPKPTELAEHFNRLGFKLNTRKNDRLAETETVTPEEPPHPSPPPTRDRDRPRPAPRPLQHQQHRAGDRPPISRSRSPPPASQSHSRSPLAARPYADAEVRYPPSGSRTEFEYEDMSSTSRFLDSDRTTQAFDSVYRDARRSSRGDMRNSEDHTTFSARHAAAGPSTPRGAHLHSVDVHDIDTERSQHRIRGYAEVRTHDFARPPIHLDAILRSSEKASEGDRERPFSRGGDPRGYYDI